LQAPESFERALQLFDPLLSVRAGKSLTGKWVIERKGYIPNSEIEFLRRRRERAFRSSAKETDAFKRERKLDLARQIAEETDCAERGKRVILFVDSLDRRVFDMLAMSDIQRYGGFSRYIEELEATERKREEALNRELQNQNIAKSEETYDQLNFLWKHRETELLAGKRNLKELLK